MADVYLRPLTIDDAAMSYKWRNDSQLWRYTGSRPNCVVTEGMEREWAAKVLSDKHRANFAICLVRDGKYIGNIYLTRIDGVRGELGIFIGDRSEHGRGLGHQALESLKIVAKNNLGLKEIYISARQENAPAIATYIKSGAKQILSEKKDWVSYVIELN